MATSEFNDIFQKELADSSKTEKCAEVLPPFQGTPVTMLDRVSDVDSAEGIKRIERFLDLLEGYGEKLKDMGSTLKELHSVVSDMEDEAAEITSFLGSMPQGDELGDIMNRAAVAATVEAIKFNRGDYI
jgi:hypothetical protein